MTADERAYLLASREIMGGAGLTMLAATEITQRSDFSSNPSRWFELVEQLRPMHDYWAQIQTLIPPPRLEALHTAYVDTLYNVDKAATLYEQGFNSFDVNLILAANDHLAAATEALRRAGREIDTFEAVANVDIAEDLD
jgi:hypothetical protein